MKALMERWQKLRPVHPLTLEPQSEQEAFQLVQPALAQLENLGYVLVEHIP